MGAKARVVLYADSEPQAAAAAARAFDTIERLEQVLSDYRVSSEVSALATAAPGDWTPISDDLTRALTASIDLSARTDGAFDVTVGPLVRLWREARRAGQRPAEADLAAARAATGSRHVRLDESSGRVIMLVPGVRLDFGGIGKGLAAHAALRTLADAGHPRALVDLGGDLALGEPPPGRPGWVVAVRTGLDAERSLTLANTCVATSGDIEQHTVIDGVRYAHIIDPRTGEPVTRPRAATVIHPDGATADALASAACVVGVEGARRLAEEFRSASIDVTEADE